LADIQMHAMGISCLWRLLLYIDIRRCLAVGWKRQIQNWVGVEPLFITHPTSLLH
jgi:hypothetical protein